MQYFLQKRQPIMHHDPKPHLTSIYSSIITLIPCKKSEVRENDYKPTSQGAELNISLNRYVRCILKGYRMSMPFWNHQTFYFKDYWVLFRNSQSVLKILSLFALQQGAFWVFLRTYCNLKMSTLFRFYKYFTNDFNTKYLLVNNLHLTDILVNKLVKFSDF